MSQINLVERGSQTAKNGFKNEKDVINKFNAWKTDPMAKQWLGAMGYLLKEIEYVKAVKVVGHYKADVQVRIRIFIKLKSQEDLQNLQVKLVSNPQGFNQIDKRWVDKYVELWKIPTDITKILKKFTGEIKPISAKALKDKRRMLLTEMDLESQKKILNFFEKNKVLIISDLLKGRGEFSADWVLVILKTGGTVKWVLKSINEVMNLYSQGAIEVSKKGSLNIGKIGMQRKGGDGGRPTANMLQFKINPVEIFKI
jgi:small nuclear ribonucleoprotein (snRNP)-like protein